MKPISKLKDQARQLEQNEQWEKAAQLYLQVIRAAEEEGTSASELSLYNRIGDIYLRLGKPTEAVAFFEQAADQYAADNLFNNAIALCNKALRHMPERLELYRKLGRLSIEQGFHTEARKWFLEYAERQIRRGSLDEAFAALGELADLTDDPEVRQLLARQLHAHGRDQQAVTELGRAYAAHVRAGDTVGAQAIRDEVRTLDAAAAESLDTFVEAAPAAAGVLDGLPLLLEPEELEIESAAGAAGLDSRDTAPVPPPAAAQPVQAEAPPEKVPEAEAPEGFAPTAAAALEEPATALPLAELETAPTLAPSDAPPPLPVDLEPIEEVLPPEEEAEAAQPLSFIELEEPSAGDEEASPPAPLPLLGEEETAEEESPFAPPLPLLEDLESPGGPPLPLLEDEEEFAAPPLPLLDEEESPFAPPLPLLEDLESPGGPPLPLLEEEEEAPPPLPLLEEPAAAAPLDDEPWLDAAEEEDPLLTARALFATGERAEARRALDSLIEAAERSQDGARVLEALDALVEAEPADLAAHQRRVEATSRIGGPRAAVTPLLAFADALVRADLAVRASAVFQQVLDIDPSNAAAGAALRREREARPRKPDEGGFVDLGAMLREDDDFEQTTRWVLSDVAPTGDEEQDFVDMLEQFKEKVSEHIGEDPQAHYDLGLAYKEMGLLEEAVAEFQIALRSGQDRLKVLEELGRCFLLKEQPRVALRLLQQALQVAGRSEMEYMGVYYLLGRCHEELGSADAARDAYERVVGLDLQFHDVAERLARL